MSTRYTITLRSVVVLGTHHEFQRHQDTSADRERVRADFEKLLRKVIEERKVRLVAEEASDDKAAWESRRDVSTQLVYHDDHYGRLEGQRLGGLLIGRSDGARASHRAIRANASSIARERLASS